MCVCVCAHARARAVTSERSWIIGLPGVLGRVTGPGQGPELLHSLRLPVVWASSEWGNISAGQLPKPGGVEGEVKVGGEAAIDPAWNARQGAQQD